MTRIFIVSPKSGKLRTAEEWKKEGGENVKKAEYIVIVPDDGSHPFLIPKRTLGEFPWKKACEEAEGFFMGDDKGNVVKGFKLPTRKQFIDIRDARSCGLEQVLELIGGDQLLKDFRNGEWFWTSEVWIPAGTSAEVWSSSRCNSYLAWCSNGSFGFAYYGYVNSTYLALPLLLYDFREANV